MPNIFVVQGDPQSPDFHRVICRIPSGIWGDPGHLAVDPQTGLVYVTHRPGDNVVVVNWPLPCAALPIQLGSPYAIMPLGIAARDGFVYAAGQADGILHILNQFGGRVAELPLPAHPEAVPEGLAIGSSCVFVASHASNEVLLVRRDPTDPAIVDRLFANDGPEEIAVVPSPLLFDRIYVTNSNSDTVIALDTSPCP